MVVGLLGARQRKKVDEFVTGICIAIVQQGRVRLIELEMTQADENILLLDRILGIVVLTLGGWLLCFVPLWLGLAQIIPLISLCVVYIMSILDLTRC